jgi:hypothetical protein
MITSRPVSLPTTRIMPDLPVRVGPPIMKMPRRVEGQGLGLLGKPTPVGGMVGRWKPTDRVDLTDPDSRSTRVGKKLASGR